MTKQKRLTTKHMLKDETIDYVFDVYEGAMNTAKASETEQNKKKFLREATILRNYLIRDRLPELPIQEIKFLYETRNERDSAQLLLELFAKNATTKEDLIWAYNENFEEIDTIIKRKLKKLKADWFEITEEAIKGSRICYLCVEQMIAEAKTLGDIIFALEANKRDLTNKDIKKQNQEVLLEKAPNMRITQSERQELHDEFIIKNGKIKLTNW